LAYRGKNFKDRKEKYRPSASDTTRVPMLNLRRINEFKYDLRDAMNNKEMDPTLMQSFLANIIAKASRSSIVEAKQYVRESQTNGVISKDLSDNICYVLDRYTKFQSQNNQT
jgi:hypothetical protein